MFGIKTELALLQKIIWEERQMEAGILGWFWGGLEWSVLTRMEDWSVGSSHGRKYTSQEWSYRQKLVWHWREANCF
jgi:hypothetical protein